MSEHEKAVEAVMVITTTDDKAKADAMADRIIEAGLGACVQVSGPITSVYRWEGKVDRATEWVCTIKTLVSKQDELFDFLASIHSYDEPELVAVPLAGGSVGYLSWLSEQVSN